MANVELPKSFLTQALEIVDARFGNWNKGRKQAQENSLREFIELYGKQSTDVLSILLQTGVQAEIVAAAPEVLSETNLLSVGWKFSFPPGYDVEAALQGFGPFAQVFPVLRVVEKEEGEYLKVEFEQGQKQPLALFRRHSTGPFSTMHNQTLFRHPQPGIRKLDILSLVFPPHFVIPEHQAGDIQAYEEYLAFLASQCLVAVTKTWEFPPKSANTVR